MAEQDRLAALAANDPNAYLAEIRKKDEDRWLQELQRLDPSAHQVEIDRRETARRQEIARRENERRQEIAALEEEVRAFQRANTNATCGSTSRAQQAGTGR